MKYASMLLTIASRTLLDNTLAIIQGMFGPAVQLVDRSDHPAVPEAVKTQSAPGEWGEELTG